MFDFEKNHLRSITAIDKRVILDHAFNCDSHDHVREDLVRQCTPNLTEKAEFTEENNHDMNVIEVRMDVYVFSPGEIKGIQQTMKFYENDITRLTKQVMSLTATLTPPPIYTMDTRFKEAEAVIIAKDKHIAELEKKNEGQAAAINRLRDRCKRKEDHLSAISAITKKY